MRAELAGKLSMSSPSRQDRLEDTLTDGVFSALSYLPRKVLAAWLRWVVPPRLHQHLTDLAVDSARLDFWPRLPGGIEPDIVIRAGSLLVVVEAKYGVPFGNAGGRHQLAAEWQLGRQVAVADALEGPIVVALTADLVEPASVSAAREQLVPAEVSAADLTADEAVVWHPWQSVAKAVDGADKDNWRPGDKELVNDLFELMRRRGVRFVYEGFKTADWWLLAAAADAATERVYPTVAEFAREITAQGAARGLVWGGTDAGVVWYESKHPSNHHRWHRNYIQLPLLHKSIGRRLKRRCGLYVLFAFNHPAIRAGWWFDPGKQGGLPARAGEIAKWLSALDAGFDVVDSTPWYREPVRLERNFSAMWLQKRLVEGAWFRVERSWAPERLTSTAPAIDLLCELAESLCADGSVLDGLAADGALDRSSAPTAVSLTVGEDEADEDDSANPSES